VSTFLRVNWPQPRISDPPNPYAPSGRERPLRITFHTSSFAVASRDEAAAITLLRELVQLPELQGIDTQQGDLDYVEIGAELPSEDQILVSLRHLDGRSVQTGIWPAHQWAEMAEHLTSTKAAGELRQSMAQQQQMYGDLLVAAAHLAVASDILVTCSPHLLGYRTAGALLNANARTPLEAAFLVGHYLRSRGVYAHEVQSTQPRSLGPYWFYWVLARQRLPAMWRHLSACLDAEKLGVALVGQVSGSVLVRGVRALKARDAVGRQFYAPQTHASQYEMLYHFDHLALSLSGALDALAAVAAQIHGLPAVGPGVSFRSKTFRKSLRHSAAAQLHTVVDGAEFQDLLELLWLPRNTIHGAALHPVLTASPRGNETFVRLTGPDATKLVQAASRLAPVDRWALQQEPSGDVRIAPYAYAVALTTESLRAIDRVAGATAVERLLPAMRPIQINAPPSDCMFEARTRERIALLG
jgi:hypothetical protein